MVDPVSNVATAIPRTIEAVAALVTAGRVDPAVAAARAYLMGRRSKRRDAHHVGELTRLVDDLARTLARARSPRRRDELAARLAGARAELAELSRIP